MKKYVGLHFIEILIILIIVSILSAIVVPIYSGHIIHEKRLEAAMTLNKLALALEQYSILHGSYQGATLTSLGFTDKIAANRYELELQLLNETSYQLSAKPIAEQAEKDTQCGTLMLNSQGEKTISGPGKMSDCW